MDRPYQFSDPDQRVTSPLDRRQQDVYRPAQAPSFTTNVNRAKTKKWVEAKQVSYGGDDWDDYDEDDEYGVSAADELPAAASSSSHGRNFTSPVSAPSQEPQLQRSNSFERGDERRAFSATNPPVQSHPRSPGPPLHVDTTAPAKQGQPLNSASSYSVSDTRQVSATSFAPSTISDSSVNPENRRDFSPSAMPPPLSASTAAAGPQSPASQNKGKPFIRPSDIYKRMEEEQEKERRASIESSRSQDATSPAPKSSEPFFPRPEPRLESTYRMGAPLETVAERKSEYGMPGLTTSDDSKPAFTSLSLPEFESGSSFGNFWDKPSQESTTSQIAKPDDSALHHQPSVGYRSMVHQAFDMPAKVSKQDSTRSQAATESSGLSRSDTTGTSDISPIMSRVPSSATAAMKQGEQRDTPPVIAEEPEIDDRGRAAILADVKPGYRRDLNPPSGTKSPARSPAVEDHKELQDPMSAEVISNLESSQAADPSFREVDLAASASASQEKPSTLAALEKAAQENFASKHEMPAEASPAISRSESPTKGRVADLAGRFNQAESRRNSTQSVDSWEGDSRPSSSHGGKEGTRPAAAREASFRPKLPGSFESYSSSVQASTPAAEDVSAKETDLEPTTTKYQVEGKAVNQGKTAEGPVAALAAAGAAVAAAVSGAVGSQSDNTDSTASRRETGDIYNRPLHPDRIDSTSSSIAPASPAKEIVERISTPPTTVKDEQSHGDSGESGEDFESDRLRRDIVRTLSPTQEEAPAQRGLDAPENRAPNRRSDVILSEYESYWAGADEDDDEEPKMSASALPTFAPKPLAPKPATVPESEKVLPDPKVATTLAPEAVPPPAATTSAAEAPVASSTRPGFLTQRFSWEMTPADSPVKEESEHKRSATVSEAAPPPEPPKDKLKPDDPLSLNPKLSSEHLQVRNAEPGELPSPEERGPSLDSIRESTPPPERSKAEGPESPVQTPTVRETPAGPRPPSGLKPQDGQEARPPSFREILAIKSTPVRVAKYNETRLQFATMDTGLEHWLKRMAATNPEFRNVQTTVYRPAVSSMTTSTNSPSGARHKTTTSLTKVFSSQGDRFGGPSDSPQEYRTSASPSDRTAAAALKGKDLLNKAGALGGKGVSKGMKEAKGLFAKGKSRFRGSGSEKAPFETSSRRSSIASVSSQSSIFSLPSSRRSSFDSTPPASRPASVDLSVASLGPNPSPHPNFNAVKLPEPQKCLPDDDSFTPWSDEWLRENVNFDVMAIFSRKKNKVEEEDEETARNTKLNAQMSGLPVANGQQPVGKIGDLPSPALPSFHFERSRPSSSNGSDVVKRGIMKNPNGSFTALASQTPQQGVSSSLTINKPTGKAEDRNSDTRIVSMLGPADGNQRDIGDDPPSPVSPVDEDEKFTGANSNGRPSALKVPSAQTSVQGTSSPGATQSPASGSPMLRATSAVGMMDVGSSPRVSFAVSEPKGKEKATDGSSTPILGTARHIRFDSTTFHPKAKEIKLHKQKGGEDKKQQGNGPEGNHSPPLRVGAAHHGNFQQAVKESQRPGVRPAPQKRANPESGALTSLHRADSQYDRMAAIANAHRMMREQFDDINDLSLAPPDLMARETAARMRARQEELERMATMTSGGVVGGPTPPLSESRPQSRSGGRTQISGTAINAERSESREPRPLTVGQPGNSRDSSAGSRSTSMPRLPPTGGPRANSIPRPESIVGMPGHKEARRRSLTNSRPGTSEGPYSVSLDTSVPLLTISKGQSPATPVVRLNHGSASPATPSSLGALPSQMNRPVSQVATFVSPDLSPDSRLSVGPELMPQNTRQSKSPSSSTPSMMANKPESVSTSQQQQLTSAKNHSLDARPSVGGRSEHSVSSLDATDHSENASPITAKRAVSPIGKNFETRQYSPPDPKKERPMSFIPLERDARGLPVSEIISTAKHPIDVTTPEDEEVKTAPNAVPGPERDPNLHLQEQPQKQRPSSLQRSSLLSAPSDQDDDLYKPPTPRRESNQTTEANGTSASTSPAKPATPEETSTAPLHSNPVKHRSIQLYDRPFSRDGTSPELSVSTAVPDANPIEHLQTPISPASKKGLLSKFMSKPQAAVLADASAHSQQSSRDTTNSSGDQRLSSMTSTTASVDGEGRDKQRRRGSGLFSLRRSSSTEPVSSHEPDDTFIPPHNQVRLNSKNVAPPPTKSKPQRSATTNVDVPGKKRRGTLGSIFARGSSSTTSTQTPKKQSAKMTVFHRVPDNPNPSAWESHQERRFSGPRGADSGKPPVNDPLHPTQGSRPTSRGGRPPSFVHSPGAIGMAAIAAQQDAQITTTISSTHQRKERRSMSLTGGGFFGKRRSDSSPSGHNRNRSNSAESQSQTKLKKGRKGNMGSISETTHQERPWAITLPGAEDHDDEESKEIERREIMHASSARWQRGADGQMHAQQDQSPASLTGSTPISPQTYPFPSQGAHNQIFSYLPSGAPSHTSSRVQDQAQRGEEFSGPHPAVSPPLQHVRRLNNYIDPEKAEIYQPSAPSQPIIPPLLQDDVPLAQPKPRRASVQGNVNDPRMDPSYRSTGASRSTTSIATASSSPRVVDNTDSTRSPYSNMESRGGPAQHSQGSLSRPVMNGRGGDGSSSVHPDNGDSPDERPPVPMKDTISLAQRGPPRGNADVGSGSPAPTTFIAALEEERRKHGEHAAMGYSGSKAKRERAGLTVNVPVTSGAPPPQVGIFSDTAAAMASTTASANRRRANDDSDDDVPVMKATSFPGDEWVPEFYYE
ncbi:uncharacterized protein PV09_01720 [Verruconis gallopava]|uniref:Uncharacterized protein n=1 Tax=Verruconis gallopava TaxID=253628 RepID=A0A0D1XYA0_9PEZI|nr:uncharacterized protein PV09_01720 [Verruconis gallopava]KIW07796.1 hypothetical protein PV09_01720 [Verruconis gallopava]